MPNKKPNLLEMKLVMYERIVEKMQGHIFYIEDEDGHLTRWTPPRHPLAGVEEKPE